MTKKRNSPGCRLLRVAVETGNWEILSKLGFKVRDFTEDAQVVHRWTDNYIRKYDKLPSIDLIESETGVILPSSCDFDYAVEKFKDYLLRRQITDRINQIKSELNNGRVKAAAAGFNPLDIETSTLASFKLDREGRYKEYEERKFRGLDGIEIPWPTLAASFVKWENSTLNVFLAPSNTGKTWISCYIANFLLQKDKKVLFISMENGAGSIGRRLDSLHYKVPFSDIRSANADMRVEKAWRARLRQDMLGDIYIATRKETPTVADVQALVRSERPDLVIIDGAYLLEGSGRNKWESSEKVLSELQLAAKMSPAPWICSSQLKNPKKKSTGYEMGYEAKYATEWMTHPETSFILLQDEDDRNFDRAQIMVAKIREAGDVTNCRKEFMIHSNRTTMDFSEIQEDLEYGIDY